MDGVAAHIKHILDEIIVLFVLPLSSKLRITSITDSSVQLRLPRVARSGKSSKKRLPIRLMISEMLVTSLEGLLCLETLLMVLTVLMHACFFIRNIFFLKLLQKSGHLWFR